MPAPNKVELAATDHVATNRYFDRTHGCEAVKLLPGEYYVTQGDIVLVTVLGSCVSACIRDRVSGIGGMNHFMLPEAGGGVISASARYGTFAMEILINELLKLGARRNQMEVKVFGGGSVMQTLAGSQVGERNVEFVLDYLRAERLPIVAKDVLDRYPRKVYFFPRTGRVRRKMLYELHNDTILRREKAYLQQLDVAPAGGDVELF
jgi:chemotaxis protein CheD